MKHLHVLFTAFCLLILLGSCDKILYKPDYSMQGSYYQFVNFDQHGYKSDSVLIKIYVSSSSTDLYLGEEYIGYGRMMRNSGGKYKFHIDGSCSYELMIGEKKADARLFSLQLNYDDPNWKGELSVKLASGDTLHFRGLTLLSGYPDDDY